MRKLNICIFSLLFCLSLSAQELYKSGYILLEEGDTLYGQIDHKIDKYLAHKVCFKSSESADVVTYKAGDVFGFCLNDGRFFVTKDAEGDTVFLEYLVNGKVDLYYMRRDDEYDCYYIQKEGMELVLLPYFEDVVIIETEEHDPLTGAHGVRSSKQHIGLLKYYMQDAPELKARIDDLGVPGHRNLKKIVTDYHDAVCDDECIIYLQKDRKTKFYPELNYGLSFISEPTLQGEDVLKAVNNYGVTLHVSLPSLNNRMYLKTGINRLAYTYEDDPYVALQVPLALEYMSPSGFVRPRVAFGGCMVLLDDGDTYKEIVALFYLAAGVNVKLHKKLFLTCEGLLYSKTPSASLGMVFIY